MQTPDFHVVPHVLLPRRLLRWRPGMSLQVAALVSLGALSACRPSTVVVVVAAPQQAPAVAQPVPPTPAPTPSPSSPPVVCPPRTPPAGLGGVVDSEVNLENAQRWLDFADARSEERLREAADPAGVRARYRLEQSEIDDGCVSQNVLVDIGRGLFMRQFTLAEGYGNDLADIEGPGGHKPRPNYRRMQEGEFGGPDASACLNCHWKGGFLGGGDRADNSYLLGDGDDAATEDLRNPPQLWGVGWTQRVAEEMTSALLVQATAARQQARDSGGSVTVELKAKGVSFGTFTARPDGQADTSDVEGVDTDLVIKPFGWKGTFQALRTFAPASMSLHLGMQAEELVAAKEAGTLLDLELGNGANPEDPDNDGVTRELTEGQVTALETFLATLDTPIIDIPQEPEYVERWANGFDLFESVGCVSCHVPFMPVDDATYRSVTGITHAVNTIDLATQGAKPIPTLDAQGRYQVPIFSDFKRHHMGAFLDGKAERGVASDVYLTRRLWGFARATPYMHNGAAALLDEAIALHGGEGSEAKMPSDAFFELSDTDKASLRVFLLSLTRAPTVRVR